MSPRKPTHGGRRPGAGRPPKHGVPADAELRFAVPDEIRAEVMAAAAEFAMDAGLLVVIAVREFVLRERRTRRGEARRAARKAVGK